MLGGGASIKPVGCSGLCHREPLIEIVQNGTPRTLRQRAARQTSAGSCGITSSRADSSESFARRSRRASRPAPRRQRVDPVAEQAVDATPYLGKQVRVVLENCGQIDPASLEEYEKRDGMRALEECLTRLSPQDVIDKVRASGLRGRGGAGFPTAVKWDIARRAPGTKKYVICNGDEGDPGAFMDRAVLEADPFRVIEGLVIAAYAIGADEGFVYVRREYPIAVRHMRAAIRTAEARGILGAQHLRKPVQLHAARSRRRRRVRVRRRDGAHPVDRGRARDAAAAASVSGAGGTVGKAHGHQQRRDAGVPALDRPPGP